MGELVPVRLDLQQHNVTDTFCWNVHESDEALEEFCVAFCRDAGLPELPCAKEVAGQVRRQVQQWRTAVEATSAKAAAGSSERLEVVKLDLLVGNTHVQDQFVWDVLNAEADPEAFAAALAADLGLTKQQPAAHAELAFAIREQVAKLHKQSNKRAAVQPIVRSASLTRDTRDAAKKRGRLEGGSNIGTQLKSIYDSGVVRKRREWPMWGPLAKELSLEELASRLHPPQGPQQQASAHGKPQQPAVQGAASDLSLPQASGSIAAARSASLASLQQQQVAAAVRQSPALSLASPHGPQQNTSGLPPGGGSDQQQQAQLQAVQQQQLAMQRNAAAAAQRAAAQQQHLAMLQQQQQQQAQQQAYGEYGDLALAGSMQLQGNLGSGGSSAADHSQMVQQLMRQQSRQQQQVRQQQQQMHPAQQQQQLLQQAMGMMSSAGMPAASMDQLLQQQQQQQAAQLINQLQQPGAQQQDQASLLARQQQAMKAAAMARYQGQMMQQQQSQQQMTSEGMGMSQQQAAAFQRYAMQQQQQAAAQQQPNGAQMWAYQQFGS